MPKCFCSTIGFTVLLMWEHTECPYHQFIWPVVEISFKKYLMILSHYLLQAPGNNLSNAAQGTVVLLSSKDTLLAHVQLGLALPSPFLQSYILYG